jgi:hypothetical protein
MKLSSTTSHVIKNILLQSETKQYTEGDNFLKSQHLLCCGFSADCSWYFEASMLSFHAILNLVSFFFFSDRQCHYSV